MSSRVGLCKVLPFAALVTSVGTGVQDGFTKLLEVPGSELVAGHSYKAIITGTCGHFESKDRKRKWQRADLLATLAGDATFLGKMHSQWGAYGPWEGHLSIVTGNWTTGFRGLPFQMILDFTAASTPKDFRIEGRIKDSTTANPGGSFLVEDLAIVLWDKTQIGLESGIESIETVGGPLDFPYSNQSAVQVASDLSVPTAGDWMIYHSAYMTAKQAANNDHVRCEDSSATNLWKPLGIHDFGNPSAAATTLWVGQQGIRTLSTSSKLRQKIQGDYGSGTKGKLWIGELFAVRLHADQSAFFTAPAIALSFWEMMWQGSPVGTSFVVPYGTEMFVFGHASMDIAAAAHTVNNVIDGGEAHPVSVRAGGGVGQSNLPVTQVAAPDLHEGTHQAELYGDRLWLDDPKITSPALSAVDVQVYGFGFLVNYVPSLPNLEIQGPVTPIVPGRETTISTSSLPTLPSEPSSPLPVEVSGELRELRTPRGDVISSPKFLKGRRLYQLTWTGLSKTEGEALDAFFDGLRSQGGAFRWQPPGDFADVAWAMDGESYSFSRDPAGPITVSFQAIELVFVAP